MGCVSAGGFRQETLPQFPSLPNVLGRPGLVGCEDLPVRCMSKAQWARVLRQPAEGVCEFSRWSSWAVFMFPVPRNT